MQEKINFKSDYIQYAKSVQYWLPMDTEELYQYNLKHNRHLLEEHKWIDAEIKYEFNSYGFRCDEFSSDPTAMFLGCSFTCGIGLPKQMIWPEILSQHLGLRCANLGIGGGSPDTAFRLCLGYIELIKPKILFYLEPPEGRVELVSDIESINITASCDNNDKNIANFYKLWIQGGYHNVKLNALKNALSIQKLCDNIDIPCYILSMVDFLKLDLARDLVHGGAFSHAAFANKIFDRIKKDL